MFAIHILCICLSLYLLHGIEFWSSTYKVHLHLLLITQKQFIRIVLLMLIEMPIAQFIARD